MVVCDVETSHSKSMFSSTDIIENYFVVGYIKQVEAAEGSSGVLPAGMAPACTLQLLSLSPSLSASGGASLL